MSNTPEIQIENKVVKLNRFKGLANSFFDNSDKIDKIIAIGEVARFAYDVIDKLKNESIKIYNDKLKPLLAIVEDIENKLQENNLSEEQVQENYNRLFDVHDKIKIEADELEKKKRLQYFGAGALLLGATATAIIKSIYGSANIKN